MFNSRMPGTITAACGSPPSNIANFSAAARLTNSPPYLPCGPCTTQLPRPSLPMRHVEFEERYDLAWPKKLPMTRTPSSGNAQCGRGGVGIRLGNAGEDIREI